MHCTSVNKPHLHQAQCFQSCALVPLSRPILLDPTLPLLSTQVIPIYICATQFETLHSVVTTPHFNVLHARVKSSSKMQL